MPDISARLKSGMLSGTVDPSLLEDALREISELKAKGSALEEILIILVRSGLPWDADGTPGASFPAFQERYLSARHEACGLLGLELRTLITRSEPAT